MDEFEIDATDPVVRDKEVVEEEGWLQLVRRKDIVETKTTNIANILDFLNIKPNLVLFRKDAYANLTIEISNFQ